MSLLGKLFSNEKPSSYLVARKEVIENLSQALILFGITSLKVKVGDYNGENTDTLFIFSSKKNNPDVEKFLQKSLLQPHTVKNLMSIGFTQIGICESGDHRTIYIPFSKFSQIQDVYIFNIKTIVSKIERHFDTVINSFGIEERGSYLYNQLSTSSTYGSYLGYLVIPVDEDGEYLITKSSSNDFDISDPLGMFEIQSSIIPTQELINFIQKELQGRIYCNKMIRYEQAPDKNRILSNMAPEDRFVYIHYYID